MTDILLGAGIGDIAVGDSKGIISADRDDLTDIKDRLSRRTNRAGITGTVNDALAGADVFVGSG